MEQVQTMSIAIPASVVADPARVVRMQHDIVAALAAIPGVTSVGFADSMPMEARVAGWNTVSVEGIPDVPGEPGPLREHRFVSVDFLRTTGTRLVAGREFTWTDVRGRTHGDQLTEAEVPHGPLPRDGDDPFVRGACILEASTGQDRRGSSV